MLTDAIVIDPTEMIDKIIELVRDLPGLELAKIQFISARNPEDYPPGFHQTLLAISSLKDVVMAVAK